MSDREIKGSTSGVQTPLDSGLVQIKPLSKVAGGIPAIISTVRAAWEEMGAVRGVRSLLKLNQKTGFDCPGCAWPEPDGERSHAEFCENGAKHVADEATTKRITPDFFRQWSVAELAAKSDYWLGKQGRVTQPMILRRGANNYEPISWDEAFALIAGELNSLSHPDEAIFYTSGRTSNEAAFLYQLFVRQFGTNNLPDCSNMCHESSSSALGGRNDRGGEGNRDARGFRSCRSHLRDWTKPGHKPSTDADSAAEGKTQRLQPRAYQSASRSRDDAVSASAGCFGLVGKRNGVG